MDIKDFILISGGILIAMVVGHGFWIAWRAKREPLRLDIVPDLIPDDVDEIERLRGELPNGGARVVNAGQRKRTANPGAQGEAAGFELQTSFDLDEPTPVLMDPAPQHKAKPSAQQAPPRPVEPEFELVSEVDGQAQPAKASVTDVDVSAAIVPEPITAASRQPRQKGADRSAKSARIDTQVTETVPVEELLVINVLAPRERPFCGEDLVNALRAQGLRFGDMNIFHRIDPATKAKLYSVANAVEPGTFDMADLDAVSSPGISFFLQLPCADNALSVFEDMVRTARQVSVSLGGELRDEQLSVLTGQTVEHMRQRIADFARRRLSKRA